MNLIDSVERLAVVALGGAPTSLQRLMAVGTRTENAAGERLEPEVAAALRLLNAMPDSDFSKLPLAEARAQIDHEAAIFGGPPLPMAVVRDLIIPAGGHELPARLYRARETDANRLLVYFHGGGWVVGGLDSADSGCRFIATHANVSVLSVGYRLAPEHPWPAAPDDALAAFNFAVAKAEEWGHDRDLIAVGGDSAGGTLSAVLCQDLREAEVAPVFQLLFYPCTDLSSKRATYTEFSEGYFLTEGQMDWYLNHYLPEGIDRTQPRVSPLFAEDLSGLPPAYVAVCGFDVLRDEGLEYAEALYAAGVPVALNRHSGLIHGFTNSTGVGHTGREAMLQACGALRMAVSSGL